MIKIVKYRPRDVIGRRSMFSFVVISIIVLILAFVSTHGPDRMSEVAGRYTTGCVIWHRPDPADKIPIDRRLSLRDLLPGGFEAIRF